MFQENFFDKFRVLPLFQGISRAHFLEIVGRVKLHFQTVGQGSVIVREGDLCTGLYFITKGELEVVKVSPSKDSELHEWINLPMVIEPESLFGLSTHYTRTFIAHSTVQMFLLEKEVVRDVLFTYPTFRFNYLNMMSYKVQTAQRLLWLSAADDLEKRFIQYLRINCLRPAGRKYLKIKMTSLSTQLLSTRLNISIMLNNLKNKDLLQLGRGSILIPNMERLIVGQ